MDFVEEQRNEISFLEAIFMEDFVRLEVAGEGDGPLSFALVVVPHQAGSSTNHLALRLSLRLPPSYPAVPLAASDMQLELVKGQLHASVLADLCGVLVREARSNAGQPAVFAMIEKLREHLELYNGDVTEGAFVAFSDEVLCKVCFYLDAGDLCALSLVNRNFKRVSEDPQIWSELCRLEMLRPPPMDDAAEGGLKRFYLRSKRLLRPEPQLIAVVVARRGTDDDWPSHIGNWRKYFKRDMKDRFELSLVQGQIVPISESVYSLPRGHYRFLDEPLVERLYGSTPWLRHCRQQPATCPYVAGVVGAVAFSFIEGSIPWSIDISRPHPAPDARTHILDAFVTCSRGAIARLDPASPPLWFACVQQIETPLGTFLNSETLRSVGLLVDPTTASGKVHYLDEVVDIINKKLSHFTLRDADDDAAGNNRQPLAAPRRTADKSAAAASSDDPDEKEKPPSKAVKKKPKKKEQPKKFVNYSDGKQMYPFRAVGVGADMAEATARFWLAGHRALGSEQLRQFLRPPPSGWS